MRGFHVSFRLPIAGNNTPIQYDVRACGQEGDIGRQSPAPGRMGMRVGQGLP